MKKKNPEWATQIYRLLLLGIMFGVLWVKEYLWCAFTLALLLFLSDALILPIVQIAMSLSPDPGTPRRRRSSRATISAPPFETDDDEAGPPVGGGEDFREPMPGGRSSSRRKGS